MLKPAFLIVSLFACISLHAQQRPLLPERRRPLLQELQLTQRQRMEIKELIRQQRAQELLNNLRLQQILTPQQKAKLQAYLKRKDLLDSLDQPKKQP